MVQIENISKKYGNIEALRNINLTIHDGEIVALLGVNGAGKSTLMKILAGILLPDSGTVNIGGYNLYIDDREGQKQIGYLSEDNPLYEDMYVREYLYYVADIYRVNKGEIDLLIDKAGLKQESKKKIGALSKGNRQRVGIAQALIHNPALLILDEPTNGLDPNQRENLNRLLIEQTKNKIILLSTHLLKEVQTSCTRYILIHKGQIIADKSQREIESLEETFYKLTNENNS